MRSRAKLLGSVLATFGAIALFGMAAWVQARQWSDPSPSYVGAVALAGCGMAMALAAGVLGWKMAREARPVPVTVGARPRVPFWIAVEAPFERPPRD
ncbi:MAG TPA: hypothetical protein VF316_21820 [Polyangiaceae bacterium]